MPYFLSKRLSTEWGPSRLLVFTLLVALVATLAAGCGAATADRAGAEPLVVSSPPAQASGGKSLNLPGAEPLTLDPALVQDARSAQYVVEIFSGLVTINENLEVAPDIAKSWDVEADGTVYVFHIRPDAKFQDGKPVRAQDFKYSWERAADPALHSNTTDTYLGDVVGVRDKLSGQSKDVRGVEVIDDQTLRVTIDSPKAFVLAKLTSPVAFVVDRTNVEKGKDWFLRPNGSGPFKLTSWTKDTSVVLNRNDAFYGTKARLDTVTFVVPYGNAMQLYEKGDLDMVAVGQSNVERVRDPANPLNRELHVVANWDVQYIGLNVNAPPFDDVKVRQAFNYALDKQRLLRAIDLNMSVLAKGILPPGMPGYEPNLAGYEYNVEKARQLIAESKYGSVDNFPPIVLRVSGEGGSASPHVTAVVESYRQSLGVDIQVLQGDWGAYLSDLEVGKHQMFGVTSGWIADYPDPHNFLDLLFYSGSNENRTGYSSTEVDQLLDSARKELNQEKRIALYQQAEQRILEDAPWVPLSHGREFWLMKPYVQGAESPPMPIPWLARVSIEGR